MVNQQAYLGTGVLYPIQVTPYGRIALASGVDCVKSDLIQLLSTPVGTRFFLPEYGSRLHEVLFEPVDEVLESLIRLFAFEAIEDWEKRVKPINITFDHDPDNMAIYCTIQVKILQSNEVDSFIYPFYRALKY